MSRERSSLNALLLRADGAVEFIDDFPRADSLSRFQRLVGGYIEEVPVRLVDRSIPAGMVTAYVNEEGKVQGLRDNVYALEHGTGEKRLVGNIILVGSDPRRATELPVSETRVHLPEELRRNIPQRETTPHQV